MAYRSFEELEVWKRGCRMAVDIYHALERCKDFGLRDQMRRCAVSVPSNIAEGYERDGKADFVRFLRIAKGSAAELRTQLYIAAKLDVIVADQVNPLIAESREISAMLQGLIAVKRKALTQNS